MKKWLALGALVAVAVGVFVLTFFQPFVATVGDSAAYGEFTAFLEQRGSLDYITARIETLDAETAATRGEARLLGPRDKG